MGVRVTIIGGGVVGLTTAYAMVRQGIEVSVIDACTELATETSYANGGQLSYRYVAPLADSGVPLQAIGWMLRKNSPLKLRPRLDLHQWRWMFDFLMACRGSVNQNSAQLLLALAMESRVELNKWRTEDSLDDFGWRSNGKLVVFRNSSSFSQSRANLMDPASQQVVSGEELDILEPSLTGKGFTGGIFTPDEEVGDCYEFCQGLVRKLQASGLCTFLLGQTVKSFRIMDNRIVAAKCDGYEHAVDQLVLCTGYRTAKLSIPKLETPIYPLKGYSLTLPVESPHAAPEISITDYDQKIVYARLKDKLRIAAMVDIVGYDPSIDAHRIKSLRSAAKEMFPNGGNYEKAVEWAGIRPATPTGVPIVGKNETYNNLWLNIGHGALGFTLACGSASRIARTMLSGARVTLEPTRANIF